VDPVDTPEHIRGKVDRRFAVPVLVDVLAEVLN